MANWVVFVVVLAVGVAAFADYFHRHGKPWRAAIGTALMLPLLPVLLPLAGALSLIESTREEMRLRRMRYADDDPRRGDRGRVRMLLARKKAELESKAPREERIARLAEIDRQLDQESARRS